MDIQDKVAIVTGAGSGIGRASAIRLASEGAAVVVADINETGGKETVTEIESAGKQALFVKTDVTEPASVQQLIAATEDTYGGLDILHNNAGILGGPASFPDADPAAWIPVLDVNLRGVILGTQYGILSMRKRGGGVIVNTASMAGIGFGYPANPVYAASKGGVILFTASCASLMGSDNIRVNCVCPGVVDTPMFSRTREATGALSEATTAFFETLELISPDEIADIVVQFVTDDTLAGRAMMIANGRERKLVPQADPAAAWRSDS